MRRKIIRIAKNTHAITLPARWLRRQNLTKGAEVLMEEGAASLLVNNPHPKRSEKSVDIDHSKLGKFYTWRYVHAAYCQGLDRVRILYKNKRDLEDIETIPRWFIGLAITSQRKGEVTLQSLSEPDKDEYKNMRSRAWHLCKDIIEQSCEQGPSKALKKRDYMLNSFIAYCLRYTSRHHTDQESVPELLALERLADLACEHQVSKRELTLFDHLHETHFKKKLDHTRARALLEKSSKTFKPALTDLLEQIIAGQLISSKGERP